MNSTEKAKDSGHGRSQPTTNSPLAFFGLHESHLTSAHTFGASVGSIAATTVIPTPDGSSSSQWREDLRRPDW
jgi:hypothetical protein